MSFHRLSSYSTLFCAIVMSAALMRCSRAVVNKPTEPLAARTAQLLGDLSQQYQKLAVPLAYASWEAYTQGNAEFYQKMSQREKALNDFVSSPHRFQELAALRTEIAKAPNAISDLDKRQIEVFYLMFAGNQVERALLDRITDISTQIQQEFNTFRVKIDDQQYSEIELREILKKSTDLKQLKNAWEASKVVGARVEKDLKELVRLRNEKAKKLGYGNFYEMSLAMDEHSTPALVAFFESLDQQTGETFRQAKAELDEKLARRLKIAVADLRPWHYQDPFFQVPPEVESLSLDKLYEKADIKILTANFFAGIGLPVNGVMEKSDLFPRPKKSTHAFCFDLNREGDTRVLANITPSDRWMTTMIHEFGHAVYSGTYIPKSLPFLLRDAAHTLATEGLAMMFERETKRKGWLSQAGILPEEAAQQKAYLELARRQVRSRLLIFSRWAQVMFHFEKRMYENPDQDLNRLWWDLVEKYQELKRPEGRDKPDYAAKVHIVSAPVYYHNYLLGEVFASQVHHAMAREVGGGLDPSEFFYAGKTSVGEFVQKRILDLGKSYPWQQMIEKATGKPLTTEAFAYDTK